MRRSSSWPETCGPRGTIPTACRIPPVRALLRRVHERGHDIGLHATYQTFRSAEATQEEFAALVAECEALGIDRRPNAVRQHYLRFDVPQTWLDHDTSGIDYDYSLGFAETVGFRSGTCREHPTFDLPGHRALHVRERPLTVMDVTLFDYMALGLDVAAARAEAIVERCRQHRGEAVLLYHNSTLFDTRRLRHYADFVDRLVAAG